MKRVIGLFLLSFLGLNSFSQEDQDHFIVVDLALNMMPSGSFVDKGFGDLFLPSFNLEYKYFVNDIFTVGCHVNHAMPIRTWGTSYDPDRTNVIIIPTMLKVGYFKYFYSLGAGLGLNHIKYPNSDGKNGLYFGYEFDFEVLLLSFRKVHLHNYIRYSIVKADIGTLRYLNGGMGLMFKL
jgi:hypothetical protein